MRLIIAMILGVLVYLGLHLGVLRKPLTIGYISTAYDHKLAYAAGLDGQKVVIIGGSSSLFSLRCQTIAAETGMPCVNMAVTAGLGIDLILAKAEAAIRPGDVVVLPLEYDFYRADAESMRGNSVANQYVATYDRALLAGFDWRRRGAALLSVSVQDAYASAVEMALQSKGFQRRFTVAQLTPQGDMTGHSLDKAADYAAYVAGLGGIVPPAPVMESQGARLILDFIARQQARGVRVYGAFPTTIDDGPAVLPAYDAIRRFWRDAGAGFLDVAGLARYSRADFYDTFYHLAEPAQIEHSRRLAEALRQAGGI